MFPLVALIGRPNVGKSTLFNRLVGKRLAIVHDLPGVTRDRHYADTLLGKRTITLIDTGGFDPGDEDPMRQGIWRQVVAAIEEADVTVCVLDSQGLPTEADRSAVELLRKSGKPVVYFANRADNPQRELEAGDLFRLGIEPLIAGSALHARNIDVLRNAILECLPESPAQEVVSDLASFDEAGESDFEPAEEQDQEQIQEKPRTRVTPRVALVGRPNAGKSSFLNLLWGGERVLVDDRPGTTRDSVDADIEFKGKRYTVIDTAGIRRKAKVTEAVEAASVMQAIRAIGYADVVVLLCDATEGLADQDAKLLALATDRGRGVIVGLNKMDLLSKRDREKAVQAAKDVLHFAPWVPVLSLSIAKRQGIAPLMHAVEQAHAELTRRVGTSELNRFVAEVVDRTPPPSPGGRTPRLYYVTQAGTAPPLFVFMCSSPKAIPASYRRFIQNQLRTAFGFKSVPVVVHYRERRRREQGVTHETRKLSK